MRDKVSSLNFAAASELTVTTTTFWPDFSDGSKELFNPECVHTPARYDDFPSII